MMLTLENDAMDVTDTWVLPPTRPISTTNPTACLVHIYPPGPGMGTRHVLERSPSTLGRSEDCNIVVRDHSASRCHARIQPRGDGYELVDLNSTNGTFINDREVTHSVLHDGDYIRTGNVLFRFLAGGNVEAEYHEEIYRLTIIDGLTEVHNKRYLLELLDQEVMRSTRHRRPLSLLMVDIDWFKSINDEHGHLAGDRILRGVASRLRAEVNPEDVLARYGGEEFAVVLVETPNEEARQRAERFRQRVQDRPFEFEGRRVTLTISLGIATATGEDAPSATELLRRADENLYLAKQAGRNRCVG